MGKASASPRCTARGLQTEHPAMGCRRRNLETKPSEDRFVLISLGITVTLGGWACEAPRYKEIVPLGLARGGLSITLIREIVIR